MFSSSEKGKHMFNSNANHMVRKHRSMKSQNEQKKEAVTKLVTALVTASLYKNRLELQCCSFSKDIFQN